MIDTTKPISAVKYNGQELPMQGAVITDGIVIKSVNDNGYPTEVDIYGENIHEYMFGSSYGADTSGGWQYVTTVNFKSTVKTIGAYAFVGCKAYVPIVPDGVQKIGDGAFRSCGKNADFEFVIPDSVTYVGGECVRSAGIARYIHRNARDLYRYGGGSDNIVNGSPFYDWAPSQYCQLGDVGYPPVTTIYYQKMPRGVAGMTMVIYTVGTAVDSLLTEFHRRNTICVFIAKAAENTTYNGTEYSAGDTLLTSEVAAG